jgi:signal transduction histidine kinase
MTAAEARRVFEPGYTTKRRGWGLGLALARRIVEEYHGGRLQVRDSAPGQGTTMVISFRT